VLLGILGGLTNRKIGDNLGPSESSVKNIIQQLFGKAGVRTRSQLVRLALEDQTSAAQDFIEWRPNEVLNDCAEVSRTPASNRSQSSRGQAII